MEVDAGAGAELEMSGEEEQRTGSAAAMFIASLEGGFPTKTHPPTLR